MREVVVKNQVWAIVAALVVRAPLRWRFPDEV